MRFWALFEQGRESGELKPLHDDPFHCASAAIGSTVFYVAALSRLVPQQGFQPLDPQQAAAHKEQALLAHRLLLGIPETTTDLPSAIESPGRDPGGNMSTVARKQVTTEIGKPSCRERVWRDV